MNFTAQEIGMIFDTDLPIVHQEEFYNGWTDFIQSKSGLKIWCGRTYAVQSIAGVIPTQFVHIPTMFVSCDWGTATGHITDDRRYTINANNAYAINFLCIGW